MTEEREEFAVGDRVWNTQTGQTGTIVAMSPMGKLATGHRIDRIRNAADRTVPVYLPPWMFTKDREKAARFFRDRMRRARDEATKWETILASVLTS